MKHLLSSISMLPSPDDMKRKLQSLAMLDAILMPDWEMRFFSFNSKWGVGEMMGSMRDGQGSEFFFLFDAHGVAAKIYCKGSSLVTPVLDDVPRDFSSFLEESAFSISNATCYLWRRRKEDRWTASPSNTNEIPLLSFIVDKGEFYRNWAEFYYETCLDIKLVDALFRHEPLTEQLVVSLNPGTAIKSLLAEAEEIGYPA